MGQVAYERLNFVRQDGDYLTTNRVALGAKTATFRVVVWWRPLPAMLEQDEVTGSWFLSMFTTRGLPIVQNTAMRDRTDCLLGVSTQGRPVGAVVPYDPKSRGVLGPNAWQADGVLLLYLPGGFVPDDFTLY